jgi:hypothetical protein
MEGSLPHPPETQMTRCSLAPDHIRDQPTFNRAHPSEGSE